MLFFMTGSVSFYYRTLLEALSEGDISSLISLYFEAFFGGDLAYDSFLEDRYSLL